ncbi:MAG: hypothetical protein IPK64_03435 [bacterium]|nr:hypothetical protein [bacterium]
MPTRRCPSCGFLFTKRGYFGLRSQRFSCPQCGAPLAADLRRAILAVFIQAPLLALAITAAVRNPWYWLGVPPVLYLCFLIHYACFSVVADQPRRS